MTSLFKDPVSISHQWLAAVLKDDMVAVDATVGNGYDTLFLAEQVGSRGRVYGFDIQEEAIRETEKRLREHQVEDRVQLIMAGHERLLEFVHVPINGMIFNLGYRPKGDKNIITRPETTLEALEAGMKLLLPLGLIILTVYIGHPGGLDEWGKLQKYISRLTQEDWDVVQLNFPNRNNRSPFNIGIQKIG